MGMYNIIDLKKSCPNCFEKVEWQTKGLIIDGIYPLANVLETYALDKRISGEVYTLCDKCGAWSEAKMKNGKLYNLKVKRQKIKP